MAGLYPDNRRVRPTGRMILYHLGELTLRIGNVTDPPTVQINRGVQLHLLDLLDTDITQTRWPQMSLDSDVSRPLRPDLRRLT
jgi:hypothetical protein